MICLGVESTSHTFGIGIMNDGGEFLADERRVYKPPVGKGIIPHEAAEHHEKIKEEVLKNCLEKSKLTMEDIDIVAYSAGPGLPPSLLVGANFSIRLSKKYKKPLIPVNHPLAHLEIGKLTTKTKDPVYLYLSGGNTQIIAFTEGRYRIFGETEDIPIGNALDSLARDIGIEPPYGPNFDKFAEKGKKYIELPYVVKGMDLSFSGILTAAIKKFQSGASKEDICYSMQETCFAMVTEVTERALAHTGKNEVLLIGGVASSKRMQDMIRIMCNERGARMFVVPQEYATDNGSKISWVGILSHKSNCKDLNILKKKINSKWRIDDVEVAWAKDKNKS